MIKMHCSSLYSETLKWKIVNLFFPFHQKMFIIIVLTICNNTFNREKKWEEEACSAHKNSLILTPATEKGDYFSFLLRTVFYGAQINQQKYRAKTYGETRKTQTYM